MTASLLAGGLALLGGTAHADRILPVAQPAPTTMAAPTAPTIPGSSSSRSLHFAKDPTVAPPAQVAVPPVTVPAPSPAAPAWRPAVTSRSNSFIRPVAFQQPGAGDPRGQAEDTQDYQISLEPPGPQRLFRLESEQALRERMRQEARQRPTPDRIVFPDEPILTKEPYMGRHFPPAAEIVEPSYLCHRRLYFEDKNAERYGWDLGIIQPLVSAGYFYKDLALLPYHVMTAPCRRFECNAGLPLPGEPVPYMLYPEEMSVSGAAAETGVIFLLLAAFP